jgi:hypothetical protein
MQRFLFLSCLVIAFATDVWSATVCFVNPFAVLGSKNGTSWDNAFLDLQTGLASSKCTELWVHYGTYKPTAGDDTLATFSIRKGLAVFGGFHGTETKRNQRKPDVYPTILSGQLNVIDNSIHVVIIANTDNTTILDGFTIEGGVARGPIFPVDSGGGIQLLNSNAVLRNLKVQKNFAHRGGGIANFSGNPTLIDVLIYDDVANADHELGGGMYNSKGNPTLTRVTFKENAGFDAGAFYTFKGKPQLTDVIFRDNIAMTAGAMYSDHASPILKNVTFNGNSVIGMLEIGGCFCGWGGAMVTLGSKVHLTNVTFTDNHADRFDADGRGGAAGAIYNENSSVIMNNVTVSGNSSHFTPGGIINIGNTVLLIRNTILFGNLSEDIQMDDNSAATITDSDIGGGCPGASFCFHVINSDPLLGPLQDNGGFTKTMGLGFGSPAVDAVNNNSCASTDQRDTARPQDGDGNGSKLCDMGATESRFVKKTFISVADEDGWIEECQEDVFAGCYITPSSSLLRVGDSQYNQEYQSILSFHTAEISEHAQIKSVIFRVRKAGEEGNPESFFKIANLVLAIREGSFSGNPDLEESDYQANATKEQIGFIENNPVDDWYSVDITSSKGHINRSGPTQFRLKWDLTDDNDFVPDYFKFYSGDYSNADDRPRLELEYYVP